MKLLTYINQTLNQHNIVLNAEHPMAQANLQCMNGADAIHIILLDDEDLVKLQAEIPSKSGEILQITFHYQDDCIKMTCLGRNIILLHNDSLDKINQFNKINPIIVNDKREKKLDIALVIDGTNRWLRPSPVSDSDKDGFDKAWNNLLDKITTLVTNLAKNTETRLTVLAFADQKPPDNIRSRALLPAYYIEPSIATEQDFVTFNDTILEEKLRSIKGSPGCDYVDALADTFDACQNLHWRQEARKLVILLGDSPGHSVLHPIEKGGDINIREYDVDICALKLHQKQIEIITIYIEPPEEIKLIRPQVIEHTQQQYQRLASLDSYATNDLEFDPKQLAKKINETSDMIGRGAMLGQIVS